MGVSRRDFLKLAGAAGAAGMAGKGVLELLFPGQVEAAEYAPQPKALHGKRWAITIDTKKLVENPGIMKKCAEVCHKVHNVPHVSREEIEIKWIWDDKFEHVFPTLEAQYETLVDHNLLLMCNHCDNPPCCRVCPTQATFQRWDGIVLMDFHRCIGCRFCMAACPYGARSFNFADPREFIKKPANPAFPTRTKGVVEKCNMCAERLAVGQIPACVEASAGAMAFGDIYDPTSDVRKNLKTRYSLRRKVSLGTRPHVFYLV